MAKNMAERQGGGEGDVRPFFAAVPCTASKVFRDVTSPSLAGARHLFTLECETLK
ncbi:MULTISPECIES: hypothetical protein [unclassified Streptomyces]|uniref:hypothetical protein n=1 Tax=unclassified Streptomyces TaxID=2593676 RepID=UPI0036617430